MKVISQKVTIIPVIATFLFSNVALSASNSSLTINPSITNASPSVDAELTSEQFKSTMRSGYAPNYEATYQAIRRGDKIGFATRRFERSATGFCRISMYTRASIFFYSDKRNEYSEFLCPDSQEIKPLNYVYNIERTFKDSHHQQMFDWANLKEHGNNNDKKWVSDLKPGDLDRISIYTKLAMDVRDGKAELSYPVNYEGKTKQYQFKIVGNESLKLPIGEVKTIKLKRVRDDNKRETYLWLGEQYHYMPVRIRQFKKGKEQADLQLKSIDYLN